MLLHVCSTVLCLLVCAGSDASGTTASNVAAVAAAAASLSGGPSMATLSRLAAANSLASSSDSFVTRGVSSTGNPAADGSDNTCKQEALQQIRAAVVALAQLNEAAYEAQQLLGMTVMQEGSSGMPASVAEDAAGETGTPRRASESGAAAGYGAASPFQQASRSARLSSGSFSGDAGLRSALYSTGPPSRRVSVDGGGPFEGTDSRTGLHSARSFSRKGRMSVDLVCPNLAKCERELARQQHHQQQQQQQQ